MPTADQTPTKPRSAKELLRAYERINVVRNQLIKQGVLDGNATPADVLRTLEQQIPDELFER